MSAGRAPRSVLGFLLIVPFPLSGQAALTGLVREDATRRPLQGVEIVVQGPGAWWKATSDMAGEYAIKGVPKGTQVVLFRKVGFHPVRIGVELSAGAVSRLDAILVPFVMRLDSLVVDAEAKRPGGMGREAFEERRRHGFGVFIDSLEMRRSEDRQLSDLLRGRSGVVIAQNRFAVSSRTGCYMQILYDGQSVYTPAAYSPPPPLARGARAAQPITAAAPFDINSFAISGLESLEMYRSRSDTPLQFGGAEAGCGTVVLWSRRGGLPPKQ